MIAANNTWSIMNYDNDEKLEVDISPVGVKILGHLKIF
jgi:hypothetical protein